MKPRQNLLLKMLRSYESKLNWELQVCKLASSSLIVRAFKSELSSSSLPRQPFESEPASPSLQVRAIELEPRLALSWARKQKPKPESDQIKSDRSRSLMVRLLRRE